LKVLIFPASIFA